VKKGKGRTVNARFAVMCAHYLFDADFCNVANTSGWEKGVVEKNVQDTRMGRCRQRLAFGCCLKRLRLPGFGTYFNPRAIPRTQAPDSPLLTVSKGETVCRIPAPKE